MKEVIIEKKTDKINLESIGEGTPIFAKSKGKLVGMVVLEKPNGWILRIGGACGSDGYFETRKECIKTGERFGYTFYVED